VRQLGVHEDDVPARQTALDDGADLVQVGVAGQDQQRRALGMELRPHLLQEHRVDPGTA
jgi:hypothetical protein